MNFDDQIGEEERPGVLMNFDDQIGEEERPGVL